MGNQSCHVFIQTFYIDQFEIVEVEWKHFGNNTSVSHFEIPKSSITKQEYRNYQTPERSGISVKNQVYPLLHGLGYKYEPLLFKCHLYSGCSLKLNSNILNIVYDYCL